MSIKIIPTQIRIKRDVSYEVVWTASFPDNKQVGECRYASKQIVLKTNESPTETLKTFIHETLHAISFEHPKLVLTERQVIILEIALYKVLILNKYI